MSEETYSVYDTKTHFSRLLKKVKAGHSVTVTDRGIPIAEIIPHHTKQTHQEVWQKWVDAGRIQPSKHSNGKKRTWPKGECRPGALRRFLTERD